MKAHVFNFHDVFLLITTSTCLLLCLLQWLVFEKRPERAVLASFMLSLAVTSITVLLMWNNKIGISPLMNRWILPYTLIGSLTLHGPLLFLYVRFLVGNTVKFQRYDLWHLALPIIVLGTIITFSVDGVDLLLRISDRNTIDLPSSLWGISKIQPVVYALACVFMVRRHIKRLQHQYASFSLTEPVWLMLLSGGFLLTWTGSLLVYFIAKFSSPQLADTLGIIDNYVTFVLIIALFVYGVAHAQKLLNTKAMNARSTSEDSYDKRDIERIVQAMEKEHIYLEHNVNLEGVADFVKLSPRTVSQIINKHFGTNFYEFINTYRIETAKKMLANHDYKEMTILDILMKSGFNSKSAFHRFFNRLVGMSPSAYRKENNSPK
ncbi:MAG: AraC-like DNA-binding protein [Flavobacteriales bacterium]|jgi:AraC-like DNA-binding protein